MLAIIRVFTTTSRQILESHGKIIEKLYDISVKNYCILDQPYGIHNSATEQMAIPKIVAEARQAEKDGADAILISCAADPALKEVRTAVCIPVLGAGTCAAAMSMAFGQRVGVLNLSGNTPLSPAVVLGSRLEMELAPEGVENTTDLLTSEGETSAIRALKRLAEKCDVVMLACTGFSTIGFAEKMRQQVDIPLVDAIEAAGAAIQLLYLQKKFKKV
jgi:allantoin racemase